jgi:IclR family transcriptional regulator, KDG regulon repressor
MRMCKNGATMRKSPKPESQSDSPRDDGDATAEGSQGTALALTLQKGLLILSMFDSEHPEWSFTDIWKKTRIPRTTALRLVRTLVMADYLSFDEGQGTYHLGVSMLRGSYILAPDEVARVAHPYMEELRSITNETVSLAVTIDHEAVLISTVLTSRPFKPDSPIRVPMPGLANIHTRVLLAHGPESEWAEALALPQTKRTPYTETDPAALREQLAKIRSEGQVIGLQEWSIGVCAVAVPVFDANGEVRASLAVIAPVERFEPADREHYVRAVRKTASQISERLGYRATR